MKNTRVIRIPAGIPSSVIENAIKLHESAKISKPVVESEKKIDTKKLVVDTKEAYENWNDENDNLSRAFEALYVDLSNVFEEHGLEQDDAEDLIAEISGSAQHGLSKISITEIVGKLKLNEAHINGPAHGRWIDALDIDKDAIDSMLSKEIKEVGENGIARIPRAIEHLIYFNTPRVHETKLRDAVVDIVQQQMLEHLDGFKINWKDKRLSKIIK